MDADAKAVADRVSGDGAAKAILARFGLKGLKQAGGEETRRFEAILLLDGVAVATVSNGGTGGCNRYWWTGGAGETAHSNAAHYLAKEYARLTDGFDFDQLDEVVEALIVRTEDERRKKALAKKGYKAAIRVYVGEAVETIGGREHRYGGKCYEIAGQDEAGLRATAERKFPGGRIEVL